MGQFIFIGLIKTCRKTKSTEVNKLFVNDPSRCGRIRYDLFPNSFGPVLLPPFTDSPEGYTN